MLKIDCSETVEASGIIDLNDIFSSLKLTTRLLLSGRE